ncbi:TetR/AcrR family transcriptional regulator [Natronospora cellulosivora (SeqCode)]
MDRKSIQEQRKRGYFIEAAKKLIQEEGVDNITVKKIADLAGFAPATLYNYFSDIDELFYVCAYDFWDECMIFVQTRAKDKKLENKIVDFSKAYAEFFINNPNIFELLFLKDFEAFKKEAIKPPEVALLLQKTLITAVEEGLISEEKLFILENIIGSSIHGLLLFYIRRRTDANKEQIIQLVEEQVSYVLNSCK